MDADWFEDPLGRFDGRYFDGTRWTERVSSDGVLQIDPDFPPAIEPEPAGFEHESSAAAVAPLESAVPRQATTAAESPVRTVAVLDESLLTVRSSDGSGAGGSPPRSSRAAWRWIGLAAAAAIAALVIFALTRGGEPPATTSADVDERVEALESGGLVDDERAAQAETLDVDIAPADQPPASSFGPQDKIQLGDFVLLNGVPLLKELGEWHRGFADERDIQVGPDAGCWFGQLGDAAVGVVQCGPVAGDASTDYLFDLVLIDFEDAANGFIVRAVLDDVTTDAVLSNALELTGYPGGPTPP